MALEVTVPEHIVRPPQVSIAPATEADDGPELNRAGSTVWPPARVWVAPGAVEDTDMVWA